MSANDKIREANARWEADAIAKCMADPTLMADLAEKDICVVCMITRIDGLCGCDPKFWQKP